MIYNQIEDISLENPILYACIVKDIRVIVEYSIPSNIPKIIPLIMGTKATRVNRGIYTFKSNVLLFIHNKPPFSFIVVTENSYSTIIAFEFLEDLKETYINKHPKSLDSKVKKYNKFTNEEKAKRVQRHIDEIKSIKHVSFQQIAKIDFEVKIKTKYSQLADMRDENLKLRGEKFDRELRA